MNPSRARRREAAVKAAATRAAKKKRRSDAAKKAARTKDTPVNKARTTAKKSQDALRRWGSQRGWRVVFLDSPRGNPRTGIVDAVLLRIAPGKPDVVQIRFVQLKGGIAGLKASECERLEAAAKGARVDTMYALYSGAFVTTIMKPRLWALPRTARHERGRRTGRGRP